MPQKKDKKIPQPILKLIGAVFMSAQNGVILIDEKGIIKLVNPAAEQLFGFAKDEMYNKNIQMLMPSPHKEKHDLYMSNYHKTGVSKIIGKGREVYGRKKDGSIFPFHLCVNEIKNGTHRLYAGIIHDLSEQKEAMEKMKNHLEQDINDQAEELSSSVSKLLQANAALQQKIKEKQSIEDKLLKREDELQDALNRERELSELKSRFITMASHEFRTPLSTILSSSDLIKMYNKVEQTEKRLKHVERIRNSVHHLNNVLDDFLSLSKLEEGVIEVRPQLFDVNELCQSIFEELETTKKPQQDLICTSNLEKLEAMLDPEVLRHILYNLLSNAIKYSPDNGTIICDYNLDGDFIVFSVEDNGMGIPYEEQQHIFSRFFRANNAINIKGTGLGLHIVLQYVKLLKGTIGFESEVGKGTKFTFSIPLNIENKAEIA